MEQVLQMFRVVPLLANEPVEIIDAGEDRVFVKGELTIRGKLSGVELDAPPFAQIIEFRDDLISLVDNYSDVAEARRAAGLAEA